MKLGQPALAGARVFRLRMGSDEGLKTYQMSVSSLQRLVDAISNLSRSSLPGSISQLSVNCKPQSIPATLLGGSLSNNVRDLVARVQRDSLSRRHFANPSQMATNMLI